MNAEVGVLEPKVRTKARKKRARAAKPEIPLIDVFAGCGGFSEGFLGYAGGTHNFKLALALDNDEHAHRTHLLRAFYHQFQRVPEDYYRLIRSEPTWEDVEKLLRQKKYQDKAKAAERAVQQRELGAGDEADQEIHSLIDERLQGRKDWVLIGGPPCQAYSIAGRSRNRGKADYEAESDQRHFLYREYLKILARHWPAVFVMENVPGVMHSKVGGELIWPKMLDDLTDPMGALGMLEDSEFRGYRLYSLVAPYQEKIDNMHVVKPDGFVVHCERLGIPQARHRVFVLGIRSDLDDERVKPKRLIEGPESTMVPCQSVIDDLPRLRSGLTQTDDKSEENWLRIMKELVDEKWWKSSKDHSKALAEAKKVLGKKLKHPPEGGLGGQFVEGDRIGSGEIPEHLRSWFIDPKLGGACNHESKAHMESDIHRYVFAACHARATRQPLRLAHFPLDLLPDHENVRNSDRSKLSHSNFADRFAVQMGHEPARTIVSHIAKDGHYYIHPDPTQGRSLSVREAARVQTFPDNFFFPGPRTEQYKQVGNAVPPYLAYQIAGIIDDVLEQAGR